MRETTGREHDTEILVIDEDFQIRRFLRSVLTTEGYRVYDAPTATEGMIVATARHPDLVVLDPGFPREDGFTVIREIRQGNPASPIVVISMRDHETDKINALDAGADDFVCKPFYMGELLARLRAVLRRSTGFSDREAGDVFRAGDVEVDFSRRRVRRAGVEVRLTRIEYRLLQIMIRHEGRVLTHRQLLSAVWGPNHIEQSHYLRVYMAQLRRKLEVDPARPQHLRTEPGIGYRFAAE